MANISEIIGYIAGSLLIIANATQIYSSIKQKSVNGIVLSYLILCCIIPLMYTVAGILDNIPYIYVPNIISFIEVFTLLLLKIHFQKNNTKINDNNYENILINEENGENEENEKKFENILIE